jgi:hypothetical protein
LANFLRDWREVLGYTAIITTILGLGFVAGTTFSSGKKELLEEQRNNLQAQVGKLTGEAGAAEKRRTELLTELIACQSKPVPQAAAHQAAPALIAPSKEEPSLKITVPKDGSGEIKGQLSLSVSAISIAYDPFRYVVSASVGTPGKPRLQAPALTIGEHVTYGAYQIRLAGADLTKAKFAIEKVSPASSQSRARPQKNKPPPARAGGRRSSTQTRTVQTWQHPPAQQEPQVSSTAQPQLVFPPQVTQHRPAMNLLSTTAPPPALQELFAAGRPPPSAGGSVTLTTRTEKAAAAFLV